MAGFGPGLSALLQLIGTGGGAAVGAAGGDPMAGMMIGQQMSQLVPGGRPQSPMAPPPPIPHAPVAPITMPPPPMPVGAAASAPGMAGPSASPSMQQLIALMQKMRGTGGGSALG